jgi:hypothetical protein
MGDERHQGGRAVRDDVRRRQLRCVATCHRRRRQRVDV